MHLLSRFFNDSVPTPSINIETTTPAPPCQDQVDIDKYNSFIELYNCTYDSYLKKINCPTVASQLNWWLTALLVLLILLWLMLVAIRVLKLEKIISGNHIIATVSIRPQP